MAVTAIWPIKSRADRVINYVRNPEKTTEAGYDELTALHVIDDVIEYTADEVKTERRSYVSCLNCREMDAAAQFLKTKRMWGKTAGRVCYHGYQSFQTDEVTAATAHEIGVKLAQELWGDRFEVVVATHCNTGHYHNHLVINSVSFMDGYKFYNSPADYARMREVSDRLCREYGLSVIKEPKQKGKQYSEWAAEKNGKPTNWGIIRADIDRVIIASTTWRDFQRVMQDMGYEFKLHGKSGALLKYPALKPPDAKGYFRFHKLGEGYSLEEIKTRILKNIHRQVPFPEYEQRQSRHRCARGTPKAQITGLRALYFRYCYELHILVRHPASVKRVSFLLREDVRKLDKLDTETKFLGKNRIRTIGELTAHKESAAAELEALTVQRQELRNTLRRLNRQGNPPAVDTLKTQTRELSSKIRLLRKEVRICESIAQRSGQVKANLDLLKQEQETERKEEEKSHELFGRRGRAGRADDIRGR